MRARPLSLLAVGLTLVGLDLRIVHVDVLPDPVGWLFVLAATVRLSLVVPSVLAAIATLASVPDVALTYHWEDLDPLTGEVVVNGGGNAYDQRLVFDLITDVRAPLAILALAAGGAAVALLLATLERRATLLGDSDAAVQLLAGRLFVLLLWVFPSAAVMTVQWLTGDGLDPVWNDGLELIALVGVIVVAAVVVGATINRNRGWTARDDERPVPWSALAAGRART